MENLIGRTIAIILLLFVVTAAGNAQVETLDEFESTNGWSYNLSDGVSMNHSIEEGVNGNAIRIDYDFTKGSGYGGIQKLFPVDLPENYEFSFWLKAESPSNNFEIKFIDSTGNNVWWVNNRNYSFPGEWQKIRIKKRHIEFAWGPAEGRDPERFDRIEFTVASFVGGRGTLWIDDLRFEPLLPEKHTWPPPAISASSSARKHLPGLMADGYDETSWQSRKTNSVDITVDFRERREFGGLQISWLEGHQAGSFEIYLSDDGRSWGKAYSVSSNRGKVSFLRLPEAEARYLRLELAEPTGNGTFGITEIEFPDVGSTKTPNDFLIYCAKNSPEGNYPGYFSEQATYWTVTGVNNDTKEALINESGMVEVDKSLFSIEPMLRVGDSLVNWSNMNPGQSMVFPGAAGETEFIPSVTWHNDGLKFVTGVSSGGTANVNSLLYIGYSFENLTDLPFDFEFYLLVRPFQVNPYYQFLNTIGGSGKINSIGEDAGGRITVDDKVILLTRAYDSFGAATFDEGNIVDMLRAGIMPPGKAASDKAGMANGVIKYSIHLEPGETTEFFAAVPYHGGKSLEGSMDVKNISGAFYSSADLWRTKTDHIRLNLPPSADRIIDTWRSNLVYILINRDNVGIQPGSRSYERSWIRDGALTSSALLKSGIVKEVRDFTDWYTSYQYESGKVPCVVDSRGPDPVPEHDSHGQLIYLIREYFNFTGDTAFLRSKNENILRAVDYIESLIAERSTDHFRDGNDSIRAYYGLVPESISHEGYSAKPMHSYWDNFFIIKGLKDAAEIQKILGESENYRRIADIRDTFSVNLYNSLDLAMKVRNIEYIPGCVELGDFDATSTTIALTPCNELHNLPVPQVYNTFEKYYDFFLERRDGRREWINYTPYENRLIGSFIMLDQPERAHELIEYFLDDQRPPAGGWNHWAEVVWNDHRHPGFIGDMPHTWCGSDFINAVRSLFVYENEYDHTLVLASALYQDWIDAPGGMSVENLPTYYGEISYSIRKEGNNYHFSISGNIDLPEGGITIRNFNGRRMPSAITVNGKEVTDFNEAKITVRELPAELVIYY
ncbi:MAG: discoidin domain-containing protein [Bacteroidales bacterium]|jgi:hypothetical protein|nr:discoidin domain-containing protein [Bacteroidales bacterium]